MSVALAPEPGGSLVVRHCPVEEYRAFTASISESDSTKRAWRRYRREFVEHYPELRNWFEAPLVERVGRLQGESVHNLTCQRCYYARRYLYFLALRGYIRLDWEWVIGARHIVVRQLLSGAGVDFGLDRLLADAYALGYYGQSISNAIYWVTARCFLHFGVVSADAIDDQQLDELTDAVVRFERHADLARLFGSADTYRECRCVYGSYLFAVRTVLYHRGQLVHEPQRERRPRPDLLISKPRMEAIKQRYLATRLLTCTRRTTERSRTALDHFIRWLAQQHAELDTLAGVTREHVIEYLVDLENDVWKSKLTEEPFATLTKRGMVAALSIFFQEVVNWGWEDVPARPLIITGDIPPMPDRIPRFIPKAQLDRIAAAIRQLPDPYQRTALTIARWTGARRGEIRRLRLDCLSAYQDGYPRIHIPVGKTLRERAIPLHPEAAEEVRALQALHRGQRPLRDEKTGTPTRYLFMRRGGLLSDGYLFDYGLRAACGAAGMEIVDGHLPITPHRFRHTVGTTLAERGASLNTIMKMLGHTSVAMAMTYISISDETVRRDYEEALGPGAVIAGPMAEALRSGSLPEATVDWIKTNFYKTELELGHCLRLPEEGPCECDLALTCTKFVTTKAYAPRLRRSLRMERELAADAEVRGWPRELERHRRRAQRLEQYLVQLGEPPDGPEAIL